jgi:hypothetical protein
MTCAPLRKTKTALALSKSGLPGVFGKIGKTFSRAFCTFFDRFSAHLPPFTPLFDPILRACKNGTYVHAKDCKSRFCNAKIKDLQLFLTIGDPAKFL